MTGNEFIELLKSKGNFMRPQDLESLVLFYEGKLLKANSADEEEKIVEGFGDLDAVMERVKAEYHKLRLDADPPQEAAAEEAFSSEESAPPEEKDDDVKVFDDKTSPSDSAAQPPQKKSEPAHSRPGIANQILDKMKLRGSQRRKGKTVLSILFSPVFVFLALAIVLVFLGAMAGIVLCAALMLALEAALILLAVVEIVYAIISFFTSVPVALIELGLGTVLVAIVVAVTALVYQLFIGVLPVAVKKVIHLGRLSFAFFYELFYGSKGGKK